MPGLSDLIRALNRFSEYTSTSQTAIAEQLIEDNLDLITSSVFASASLSVRRSTELASYPPLRDHLIEIIGEKLREPSNFFDITGIFYGKYDGVFATEEPNLSSLGTYQDWLSMKEAGQNLFDVKRQGQSAAQKLVGWKWYYNSWKWGKEKDGDKYPAIIGARLGWGKSARKAPYWYFIDKATSRAGHPQQQLVGLSASIMRTSTAMIRNMNNQLAARNQENYFTIDTSAIDDYVDLWTTSLTEEKVLPKEPQQDLFQVYGTIQGRLATYRELLELMEAGEIALSTKYESGEKVHFYYKGTGGFVGAYAKKLIE